MIGSFRSTLGWSLNLPNFALHFDGEWWRIHFEIPNLGCRSPDLHQLQKASYFVVEHGKCWVCPKPLKFWYWIQYVHVPVWDKKVGFTFYLVHHFLFALRTRKRKTRPDASEPRFLVEHWGAGVGWCRILESKMGTSNPLVHLSLAFPSDFGVCS